MDIFRLDVEYNLGETDDQLHKTTWKKTIPVTGGEKEETREELTVDDLIQKMEDGVEVTYKEYRNRYVLLDDEFSKALRTGDRLRAYKLSDQLNELEDAYFGAKRRRQEQEKKIQEEADKIQKEAWKIKVETEALSQKTDADQQVLETTEFVKNMTEEILEQKKRLSQKNVGLERTGKHKMDNTSGKETYRDIQIHLRNITGLVQKKMQHLSEEVRKRLESFMSSFQKLLAGIWKLLFIVLMLDELEKLLASLLLGDIYTSRRKRRLKYGFKMAAMLALWLSHDVESNPGPLFNNRTCMEMLVRQLSQKLRTKFSAKGTLWSKSVAKKANEAGYPRWLHWKNPSGKNKNSTPQLVQRAKKLRDILRKHNSLPPDVADLVDKLETDGNKDQLRIYFELEYFKDSAEILLQEQDLRTTHKESICKVIEELSRKCVSSDIPSTAVSPGNFAALADRSEKNLLPTCSQVSATSATARIAQDSIILTKSAMENGSSLGCSGSILGEPAPPLNIQTAESDYVLETDEEVTNTVLLLEDDFNSTPFSTPFNDLLNYLKMLPQSRRSSDGGTFQTGHEETINDDTRTTSPISQANDEDTIQYDAETTSPTFQTGPYDTRTTSLISPPRDEDTIQYYAETTSPTFQTGPYDTRTTSLMSPARDEDTIQYDVRITSPTFRTGLDDTRTTSLMSPARDEDTIQYDVRITSPTFQTGLDDTRTTSLMSPARDEETIQYDAETTPPTFQTGNDDTRITSLISPATVEDTIQCDVGTVFATFQKGHDHTVSGDGTGTTSMKAQSKNEETEYGTTFGNYPVMIPTQKVPDGGSLNEDDANDKTNSYEIRVESRLQETQNLAYVECSQSSAALSSLPDNQNLSKATQDQDSQHAIFGESDNNTMHHEDTCHDDTTFDTSRKVIERPDKTTQEEEQTRENSNVGTYLHQSSQGRSNLPDEENVDQEDVFNRTLTEQSMDQSSDDDVETQLDDDSQTTCDEEEWLRFKTQNWSRFEKVFHEMFLTYKRSNGQQASKLKMKPTKQLEKSQNVDQPDSATLPGSSIYTNGRKRRGQEEIRSAKKKREGNKTEEKNASKK